MEMGYTLPDAIELVMADKKANTMQTVTSHASLKVENDVKSPAISVQKAHSIVAAGKVAVKSKERVPKRECRRWKKSNWRLSTNNQRLCLEREVSIVKKPDTRKKLQKLRIWYQT